MSSQFGEEFDEIWPINLPKYTKYGLDLLKLCENIEKPTAKVTIQQICDETIKFPIKFPIETCKIVNQPKERHQIIKKQINSAYPLIHERVLWLYSKFLEYKREYGTNIEKEIYANLTLTDFVQRLLSKRCVSFYGKMDNYLLLNGEDGYNGFEKIGTNQEKYPLLLENCLSYDEMKLSAFLSVSSHTEFLNDGNRRNGGKIIDKEKNLIENDGIIIGLIGARLTRIQQMEYQDIIINPIQNTIDNGYNSINITQNNTEKNWNVKNFLTNLFNKNYEIEKKWHYRQIWNEFYDEKSLLYENINKNDKRFKSKIINNALNKNDDIFDNLLMKKRYTISFDTFLLESQLKSKEYNKKGYLHVVGIGLGVWRATEEQEQIFLETFSQRLKILGKNLKNISYIHFSWFKLNEWNDIKNNAFFNIDDHPDGGIRIFISKRNPADKLKGAEFENCMVIESYAWDGNALPGNEFWTGMLKSTGDPAAACSTLIAELHNPHINKTKVCGENLHIASEKYGILHISDYAKNILKSDVENVSD